MKEQNIKLSDIRFSTNRKTGGEGDIKILAESMKVHGLINAVTLKWVGEDNGNIRTYEVVAGRRRIAAAKLLGWENIPCRILEDGEENRAEEIAGSENINRMAMHPLDEAVLFATYLKGGSTIEELARQYDRKASGIWQRVQLLDLSEDIKTLFRNGFLSLHSAAMLTSLSDDAQKTFYKQFKDCWEVKRGEEIQDRQITNFISSLGHDHLYGFLKDKQCAECKTRTYFDDKTLFPELDDIGDSCLNHECYKERWIRFLANRFKSLKGEHKSHTAACLIIVNGDELPKIMGTKFSIDGIEYSVLPWHWDTNATSKESGAQPCFEITIRSGKLEIKTAYWKKSSSGTGSNLSPAKQRQGFTPIVKLLDLPKTEMDEALDALGNRKRLMPSNFANNVRDAVFWRIMEVKAQEFNDPKKVDAVCKEVFIKKYFGDYQNGNTKKVLEIFTGKPSVPADLAKLPSEKVFALLAAMEMETWKLPDPKDFGNGKANDVLTWAGLPSATLKQIYQEEIRKRIPKQKPADKKASEKNQVKSKPPAKKPPTGIKKPVSTTGDMKKKKAEKAKK
ncbi:MAG: ParB/RepB/Spo0J family partition protein [Treponema sp.]|jgi:ParB/RepB/Spo0J family partition protein|nr:ParB/RepB/Spo0J family partition protein [Treponema sp.]